METRKYTKVKQSTSMKTNDEVTMLIIWNNNPKVTFSTTAESFKACYRTFPVLGWACNFLSAQQACRSFFRVIYVGGPLKGPQLTTTADTLTPTRYCVLSLILFVN